MKKKSISPTAAAGDGSNTLRVKDDGKSPRPVLVAKAVHGPTMLAGMTMRRFTSPEFPEVDLMALIDSVADTSKAIAGGDMAQVEMMLASQMQALNSIFAELARRAALNMGQHLPAGETYMRLALKAQGQARATALTIAEIKSPRQTQFIRQTNLARHQQIIHGGEDRGSYPCDVRAHAHAPARELQKSANELLEVHDGGEALDTGAAAATSPGHM